MLSKNGFLKGTGNLFWLNNLGSFDSFEDTVRSLSKVTGCHMSRSIDIHMYTIHMFFLERVATISTERALCEQQNPQ